MPQSSSARLMVGLDGWRRQVIRRRSATAARRWSLITLCALLAGVAVGRLDGSLLLTAAAIGSIALVTGAMRVIRSRKVSAGEAARLLDATFGLDEQVATALCFVGDREPGSNPLVADLLDRAVGLVGHASDKAGTRPPAYGEWVAMAVTAAAAAAVVAAPGTVSGAHPGAADRGQGDGGARIAQRVTASLPPGVTATASAPRPGSAPVHATGKPTTAGRAAASASPAAASPAPGTRPGAPAAPAASDAPAGSPGQHPGQAGPNGAQQPGSGPSAVGRPTGGAPGPGPGSQAAPHATAQPGTGRRQAGTHSGVPGGDTAGTQHGSNRADGGPARLLPNAGDRVLLIVLPGADGSVTARSTKGTPGQRAGGSGETTVAATAPAGTAGAAAYVPPDGNEVPFADQNLLGRYF